MRGKVKWFSQEKGRRGGSLVPHYVHIGTLTQRQYERVTLSQAPVRGGALAQDDPPADRAAREIVSSELGHSRPAIASAYRRDAPIQKA